jgi:hypothetical protein
MLLFQFLILAQHRRLIGSGHKVQAAEKELLIACRSEKPRRFNSDRKMLPQSEAKPTSANESCASCYHS